jgi:predicted dehydrogenase
LTWRRDHAQLDELIVVELVGAIVGCGAIGREHAAALKSLKNVKLAAVCDISPARAAALADRFGIETWLTDHRKLLDGRKPDLVHIATPPGAHVALATDFLNAGCNVLCEKPLAPKRQDAIALKGLAVANRAMLIENQQFRRHSSVRRIQRMLESGELGDLLELHISISLDITSDGSPYIDHNVPHFSASLPGGVIGDFLPHMVYLARMFVGPIADVSSIWKKHKLDTPLVADEFRGFLNAERATAYLSFSGNAQPDAFLIRAIGTRMRVEANLFEPPKLVAKKARRGEPALMTLVDGVAESRSVFAGSVGGLYRKLAGTSSYDGMTEFIGEIYQAIETGTQPPVTLDEMDELSALFDRLVGAERRI